MKTHSAASRTEKSAPITICLPPWLRRALGGAAGSEIYASPEERMAFAVELSRQNVARGTGGPFAAAVFDAGSGRLIAAGVNMVTSTGLSVAHAEIVALSQAQALLGGFDLGGAGMPACELVSTTEPCAMCLGAIPWSGVRSLVCGARDEDARAVGFDEGAKPTDWAKALEARGIAVRRDVSREDAVAVLRGYAAADGAVYNGRKGGAMNNIHEKDWAEDAWGGHSGMAGNPYGEGEAPPEEGGEAGEGEPDAEPAN
jgi:tRNA(Arg) A34 adenosine deaminase TadA